MSAHQIPNLTTFRRTGTRGRGGRNPGASDFSDSRRRDEIIQGTDQDAATSRLSAVEAGYLDDPFARLLHVGNDVARRLPLMNRGTYVRTKGIDKVVDVFLSSQPQRKKQIISLGAGSDTRYFRIKMKQQHSSDIIYHELDFELNTRNKIHRLRTPPFIDAVKASCGIDLGSPDFDYSTISASLKSSTYCIHPQDLRQLPSSRHELPNVDTTLPTLLISECCLIYLSPVDADAVLDYFSNLFPTDHPLAIVIYEPIRPNDSFGRTMVSNLTARGIQLQTLQKYADLGQQKERLRRFGFLCDSQADATSCSGGGCAADIDFIWQRWVDDGEKERVDGLEWMDEVEEFMLLAQHYCIAWGWRGFSGVSQWAALPTQDGNG